MRLAKENVCKKHWRLECLKNKPDKALTKSYEVKYLIFKVNLSALNMLN